MVGYGKALLDGLGEVFQMFRDIFFMLPMPVQALIFFTFGGFVLLAILRSFVIEV